MEIRVDVERMGFVDWQALDFSLNEGLKEISESSFQKLKQSLIEKGFIQPLFVWESKNKIFCLDGRYRKLTLENLIQDGVTVPEALPAVFIKCKNRKDAQEKVLLYSSIYAKVTDEGLYKFSFDGGLDFERFKNIVELPNFSMSFYEMGYVRNNGNEDGASENLEEIQKRVDKSSENTQAQREQMKNISYDETATRQFVVFYKNREFTEFIERLDKVIAENEGIETYAEALNLLLEVYENARSKSASTTN